MPIITRRFEFDAGHRVLGHKGKCRHLHGHRYVAEVTVQTQELDDLGMVVDFSVLKERIGGWIDKHWDHNTMLNSDDPLASHLMNTEQRTPFLFGASNPTAENIAETLYDAAMELLIELPMDVVNVRVWETPNCYADCRSHG